MIQQVAACPVPADAIGCSAPRRSTSKVATAFGPASASARFPRASKAIAKGTAPSSVVVAGRGETAAEAVDVMTR